MTTPATEKAEPIPAEVLALAMKVAANWIGPTHEGAPFLANDIARAIMQDRADRASQEERIREDERAEAREDLLFLTGERTARDYNEAINFAVDECDEPDLFLRVWREGGCEEYADEINEWADFRAYRARARQGGNNG